MIPLTTYTSIPTFDTLGGGSTIVAPPGTTYNNGYILNQVLPAEHANYFFNGFSYNGNQEQAAIANLQNEIINALAVLSIATNSTATQLAGAMKATATANSIMIRDSSGNTALNALSVTGTTDSSSISTGSIVTAGGIGIAKSVFVGINLNVAGSSNLATISVSSSTDSTTTVTGSIVTAGGIGVAKNVTIGGNLAIAGTQSQTNTTASTSSSTGALVTAGGLGVAKSIFAGDSIFSNGSSYRVSSSVSYYSVGTYTFTVPSISGPLNLFITGVAAGGNGGNGGGSGFSFGGGGGGGCSSTNIQTCNSCGSGYLLQNNGCAYCGLGCLTCLTVGQCIQCMSNYILLGSSCAQKITFSKHIQ